MFKKPESTPAPPPAATQGPGAGRPVPVTSAATSGEGSRIAAGSRFEGELTGERDLVIAGEIVGRVKLDGSRVDVHRSGKVQANITADRIHVSGEVKGDLLGKREVVLTEFARVEGNIVSMNVTIEAGAQFNGAVDMESATMVPLRPGVSQAADASSGTRALTPSPVPSNPGPLAPLARAASDS